MGKKYFGKKTTEKHLKNLMFLRDLRISVLKLFLILFLFGFKYSSFGMASFEPTNVVITLKKTSQADSIGYNLPSEFAKLLYPKIMDGSISLWDGPLKEIRITADALKEIEQSNQTSFSSGDNLLIHEIWMLAKRTLDTKTIGFTFITSNELGKVTYGYVDYKDIMVLLDKNFIPANANGFSNTTFREAIQNKEFNFSITQFGSDDFKANPSKASEIKNQLFNNSSIKVFSSSKDMLRYKSLTFEVIKNGNENNDSLFTALCSYFKGNLEQFFNLGGDQSVSFINKEPEINITKLKVNELYKTLKGQVTSEITSIQFYVNGKYLPANDLATLRKTEINIKSQPLANFIHEKNYDLTITSINAEEISNKNSLEII